MYFMTKEQLDRVEELKQNELVLYNIIDYLVDLWGINETNEEILKHFNTIGISDEDIERLNIKDIYKMSE